MKNSEKNVIIVTDRELLSTVEEFMHYPDGDLPSNLTWNDIMPIVMKIEDEIGFNFIIDEDHVEVPILNGQIFNEGNKIKSVWAAILGYVDYHHTENYKAEK